MMVDKNTNTDQLLQSEVLAPITSTDGEGGPKQEEVNNKLLQKRCFTSRNNNLCWGILSQIALIGAFMMVHFGYFEVIVSVHMWFALILFSIVHIACNFAFYRKYVVPNCISTTSIISIKAKLCNTPNTDEEDGRSDDGVEENNGRDITFIIMLVSFFFSNLVRHTIVFTSSHDFM